MKFSPAAYEVRIVAENGESFTVHGRDIRVVDSDGDAEKTLVLRPSGSSIARCVVPHDHVLTEGTADYLKCCLNWLNDSWGKDNPISPPYSDLRTYY